MSATGEQKAAAGAGAGAKAEKISGESAMDTTKAIRDVPDHVRKEYMAMALELMKPEEDNREERVRIFENHKFSADAQKHYTEAIREREKIHFDFMGRVFPESFEKHYGHPLPKDYPQPHDCSKDALFAFILAFQFDILKSPQTDGDKDLKKRFNALVTHELNRHYTHEPHHPEHEKLVGKECSEYNIFEMAIDRIARNVQFNHGDINKDQMRKFLPKFFMEDKNKKQEKYKKFMDAYMDFVSQRARDLYYDRV